MIRSTARFLEKYALAKYDALYAAAVNAAVFERALHSNALRIRLYIKLYREYQEHLDSRFRQVPWRQNPHVQAGLQPCQAHPAYGRHQQPESGQSSKSASEPGHLRLLHPQMCRQEKDRCHKGCHAQNP